MKNYTGFALLLMILFLAESSPAYVVHVPNAEVSAQKTAALDLSPSADLPKSGKKARKPRLVERVLTRILKRKIAKKIRRGKANDGERPSSLSIVSLVFGVLSLVMLIGLFLLLGTPWLGPVLLLSFALTGIITGAISMNGTGDKSDKFGKIGLGLSVGAIVLGALLYLLLLLWFIALFGWL